MRTERKTNDQDPQWLRFWEAYKRRVAKKDAMNAWSQLQPSPELVDRMVEALAWQFAQPDWRKANYAFAPYPASYLRGRRWEDERPTDEAADPIRSVWVCPHEERCSHRAMCGHKMTLGADRYPVRQGAL